MGMGSPCDRVGRYYAADLRPGRRLRMTANESANDEAAKCGYQGSRDATQAGICAGSTSANRMSVLLIRRFRVRALRDLLVKRQAHAKGSVVVA